MKWLAVRMLQNRQEHPNHFYVKYDMNLDLKKVSIKSSNKMFESRAAIESVILPTESKSSITEAKFNDLQNLFINIRVHQYKGFALSPRNTQLKQKRTKKREEWDRKIGCEWQETQEVF